MSIQGLIALFVLAALFALWIGLPLLRRERQNAVSIESPVERQRERLNIYYSRVLRNIHDLDEDHATGKLNDDEYRREREVWVERGVAVLKRLDELDATHLVAEENADDSTIDAAIEEAVRRVREEV
jgi:hypothetical protein